MATAQMEKTGAASVVRAERAGDGHLKLVFSGELLADRLPRAWREAVSALGAARIKRLTLDLTGAPRADGAGAGLIIDLLRQAAEASAPTEIVGASVQVQSLLDLYDPKAFQVAPATPPAPKSTAEEIGEGTVGLLRDLYDQVAFIGELFAASFKALLQPRRMRWGDVMVAAERAGADALPIVALMGFLVGLIMSFQAAIPLKQFGAQLYVADFVALVMVRELGGLITAVILAGRTGSAFAAELGTMKINEELNALQTLGLDPVRFLVVGRVLAVTAMTPILSVFAVTAGIFGGLLVVVSLGFSPIAFYNEAVWILDLTQVFAGLSKTFVFGFMIAGIGCMRGLQTRSGASAVGLSATRAVVTSIVMIIAVDGIFSVVFFFLDI